MHYRKRLGVVKLILLVMFALTGASGLAALWLIVIPGSFLYARLFGRKSPNFEDLICGTALGANILPVAFSIGPIFTCDAAEVWWIIAAIVSLYNIYSLIRAFLARGRRSAFDAQGVETEIASEAADASLLAAFPFAGMLLLTLLAFLYAQHHFRSDGTNYLFSIYFGGDMPFLSAFVLDFERTTLLRDLHSGGAPMYYHDFILKLMAGIHFFSGGNIYEFVPKWFVGFDLALYTTLGWLVAYKLSASRAVAAIAAILLFVLPGADSPTYMFISSSFRMGVIQTFLGIALMLELAREEHLARMRTLAVVLAFVLATLVGWKVTDFVGIVPPMAIVGLLFWRRTHRPYLLASTIVAGIAGAAYILIMYAPANAMTGPDVIGRPIAHSFEKIQALLGTHFNPVEALNNMNAAATRDFLLLLLPYLILTCVISGRYFITLAAWPRTTRPLPFPELKWCFVLIALLGHLISVFVSKQYYHFSDPYPALYADVLLSAVSAIVIVEAYEILRRRAQRTQAALIVCVIAAAGLLIDFASAARGYYLLEQDPRASLPVQLVRDLDSAGTRLPKNALVATHRMSLQPAYAGAPMSLHLYWPDEDRNFEFYATGLRAPVIQEGPSDGFFGPISMGDPQAADPLIRPNPRYASIFWQRIHWLDSLYFSRTDNACLALDSLHATHVVIDHTIDQSLASSVTAVCDTVYNSKTITLLHKK